MLVIASILLLSILTAIEAIGNHRTAASISPIGGYCGIHGVSSGSVCWNGVDRHGACAIPNSPSDQKLVYALSVIRHGDRDTAHSQPFPCWNPDVPGGKILWDCSLTQDSFSSMNPSATSEDFPRLYRKRYDAGENVLNGNCGIGQLTKKGFDQHRANGALFRDFYIHKTGLLPESVGMARGAVYIRSDDGGRTIASAQSLMSAFFPPPPSSSSASDLWDLHTMDPYFETITINPTLCPLYSRYKDEWYKSETYRAHYKNVSLPLMKQVFDILKLRELRDPTDVSLSGTKDCLNTNLCHEHEVPTAFTQDIYNRLYAEAIWQHRNEGSFPSVSENSRAGIGFLIKQIAASIFDATSAKEEEGGGGGGGSGDAERFRLISGHDTTIIPILIAFEVWDQVEYLWAPYASFLNFEVYSDERSGEHFVRAIYNGKVLDLCKGKFSTECKLAPIEMFRKIIADITPPDDVNAFCNQK